MVLWDAYNPFHPRKKAGSQKGIDRIQRTAQLPKHLVQIIYTPMSQKLISQLDKYFQR